MKREITVAVRKIIRRFSRQTGRSMCLILLLNKPVLAQSFDDPILTVFQSTLDVTQAVSLAQTLGANHIWMKDGAGSACSQYITNANLRPVFMTNPSARTSYPTQAEWMYGVITSDWCPATGSTVAIPLKGSLAGSTNFHFALPTQLVSSTWIKVQELSPGDVVSTNLINTFLDGFSSGTVTVTAAHSGRSYRAVYPVRILSYWLGDTTNYHDGTVSTALTRHTNQLVGLIGSNPGAKVVRATSTLFFHVNYQDSNDVVKAFSWYGYNLGCSTNRIERFNNRGGSRPSYDFIWMANNGFGEEGFVPSAFYRDWINFVRGDVMKYTTNFLAPAKAAGLRGRFFWGDNWIGMEPLLGDVHNAGYDEMVTGMDRGSLAARQICSVSNDINRIVRLPWVEGDAQTIATQAAADWRWIKQEMLPELPEGITLSGNTSEVYNDQTVKAAYSNIFENFRDLHSLLHGVRPYRDPLTFYVLNVWGQMRAWPACSSYWSQRRTFAAMLDWPVKIKWLSFEELLAGPVPDDANALIVAGEPGTAWAGGSYWTNTTIKSRIASFVANRGGGLIVVGAPTVTGGALEFAGALGMQYQGPATTMASNQQWNLSRWCSTGCAVDAYDPNAVYRTAGVQVRTNLAPPQLALMLTNSGFNLLIDSKLTNSASGASAITISTNPTGIFYHDYVSTNSPPTTGRVVTIGGYGCPNLTFRALAYYAASNSAAMWNNLRADSSDVAVYYYPAAALLVAYNHGANPVTDARVYLNPGALDYGDLDSTILTNSVLTNNPQAHPGGVFSFKLPTMAPGADVVYDCYAATKRSGIAYKFDDYTATSSNMPAPSEVEVSSIAYLQGTTSGSGDSTVAYPANNSSDKFFAISSRDIGADYAGYRTNDSCLSFSIAVQTNYLVNLSGSVFSFTLKGMTNGGSSYTLHTRLYYCINPNNGGDWIPVDGQTTMAVTSSIPIAVLYNDTTKQQLDGYELTSAKVRTRTLSHTLPDISLQKYDTIKFALCIFDTRNDNTTYYAGVDNISLTGFRAVPE